MVSTGADCLRTYEDCTTMSAGGEPSTRKDCATTIESRGMSTRIARLRRLYRSPFGQFFYNWGCNGFDGGRTACGCAAALCSSGAISPHERNVYADSYEYRLAA
jgi:hypothetical protein